MRTVRDTPLIKFEETQIALFPDISRRNLMQRKMVRPLLEAMWKAEIRYRWGFPFGLIATRDGKTVVLRTKDDFKKFVAILDLPLIDFADWRRNNINSIIQRPEPWSQVPEKSRQRT